MRRFVGQTRPCQVNANYYRKFVLRFLPSLPRWRLSAALVASSRGAQQSSRASTRRLPLKAALTSAPVRRMGSSAAGAPAHRRLGAGCVGHPGAGRQRGCVSPCCFRVAQTDLLELLTVVHTLTRLRPYLLDKPFELHMDNAPLQWLLPQQGAAGQDQRERRANRGREIACRKRGDSAEGPAATNGSPA